MTRLEINTGDGADSVSATISATAEAQINTGADDDKVTLSDTSVGKAEVNTGDGNDAVEVDVGAAGGYSVGEVTVNTGDGDDSVTLTNKNRSSSTLNENQKGNITVDLGTGVNEATVSTDVAGVAPNVTIDGENGNDHVHITGTLNSDKDAKERITGTKDNLNIASDMGAMTLALEQIESLTDDLKNKRTETLTVEDGKKVNFTYEGAEAFTNYVLKAPVSKIEKIVIKGKDGESLLLSSLVIDTATTWDGENKLIIPEGAMIDAQGLTVRLTARDIQVDGTIKADLVQIEALDGTGMYSRNFSDLYEAYSGTVEVWGVDQAGSTLAAGAEMAWDLVNINDEATITIGEKGAVLASGDVILLAKVEQSGTLISIIPLNVVNVKVAHASVDIAGKVYAGVTNIDQVNKSLSNVEFDETRGSVRVNAEIKTTIGYDDKGHMTNGWPVAVSVVYANAEVTVREGAEIAAAKDIQIGSKSEIKAATRADSGLAGLPAAVAVAVLINDVRTSVDGTLDAKNGDVKVTANGDVNARTIADKGDGQTSLSGGYAAVTVAVQDVKAELGKTAVVNAKGQAQVLSNAVEKVENHATSGKQDSEEVKDDSLMGKAKSLVIDTLVSKVWPKVKEYLGKKFFPESAEEKLDKAINKVSTGDHSVKLAENAQAHGDVYTTVDTMDGKTRVTVNVTPREGYKVKRVLWRGYNAGDSKYTLGEAIGIGNDWSFIQNIQNVTVFVIYAEDDASDTSSEDEDDVDVDEFFKQYQEADDDSEVSEGEVEKIIEDMNAELEEDQELDRQLEELEEGTEFVKLTWKSSNGSVLTYETKNDDYINRLDEVYTGQKVRLIPNPKDGYKLKNGGLTATYSVKETVNGKETVVVKKVVINPDDQGRYYLEVPEKDNIEIQQGITINAVYEKGESDKTADNTQLQLTGTLAVAVTDNDNQALVDEGAQVTAGSAEVAAIANTDVQNIADGTAVSKESAAEKKSSDEYAIKRPDSKEYSGYIVEGMKFGLLADPTQNGSIKVEKVSGASAYEFTVEATPNDGYKAGTALLTYYKDGKKKTAELNLGDDGKYHFSLTASGTNALDADAGSTAVLSFGFVGEGETDVTVAEATISEPQSIISNPIQISYNALKEEKYTDGTAATFKGTILYNANNNKTDTDGNITAYAFEATPNTEKGFALDGKLKATWKDASGQTQSRELTEENGVWYLQLDGIPTGAPVKVSGAFKDDLHSFKVDTGKLEDTVSAKAGAAGGTAVVPVAAVDVTAAQANAYMGKVSADNLKLTENVGISARTDASHSISADASASGAGLGAAISVSVLSDKAWAKLNQSLEAGQVAVAAETISRVINNATASAAGGRTSGKSADSQADGLLGGASRLAGKNKSSGVTPNAITNATRDRQKAETSEGSVDVAGAVVVNVQDSVSRAEIADGVNVKAEGLLAVIAANGTTSKVKANANTTNSNVGVGVGVAVNIVGLENIARMGNGDFEAAMLKVAATTKETEPEEKKTVAPAELAQDKDAAANELAEMVSGYMADLAKEIGLDQYVPEDMLASILNPIIEEVTSELLKVTGLGDLFAGDGLEAKYDSAIKLLQGKGSALASLPEQLIAPLMEIVKDAMDLSDLSEEDYKKLAQALADEFTQAFKDNLMDYKTLGMSALDTLKGGALQWAKKEAPGILKGMFKGNQKWTNWKRMGAGLRKYLGGALVEELKRVSVKSFEEALGNVNLPGVSMLNQSRAVKAFNEVKDVYKAGELSAIFEDAAEYAIDTFKTEVFDYDKMLTALSEVDWVDKIATSLRNGAQKAMVNLTNEAVSAMTSTLGVQLEAQQEQATGHVIDTQAISGAGARSVGIAGSVAITVLNAETRATVADGGKLEVTGDLTVDADELRSVKNVASAALDSKGNAKDNKSSEDASGKDIGGNEAKSVAQNDKKNTVLTVNVGGTATIRESDKAENRPVVYITLKDGYRMPDGNKLNYTYTNKDGVEVHGTVVAKQDGDSWIIDTANDTELKKAAADAVIELELQPVEVLTELPKPSVLSDASVPEGTVSLAVRNREEQDGKLSARAGETVEVKVKRVEGMKLTGLGYAYTDENGVKHEVVVNPGDENSGKEKSFAMVSSNKNEYVYSIVMPKGQITEILAQMEAGEEEDTGASDTHATDASGAGVGVGASFSMVYGDTSAHAEVGKRSGTVNAGSINVSAASDHMENISSAAGTDPLTGDLNTTNTKTVGVDASVALNILDNDIKAFVDKASTVSVKTGDLNVTATENSITETTSSAFSVGDMTAVGASVAINLADTAVSASLEGGATVAGSAKVASDSHSEDVTKALATAMGADIARSLAKVGQTVSNDLEKQANKLLSGEYMKPSDKKDNKTAQNINDRLDKKAAGSDKTVNGQTTSSNALRALDAKTANGGEGMGDVNTGVGEVNNATGANLDGAKQQESVKVMVAAAVGITAASHEAGTRVGKIVAGKSIDLTSENTGNFNTLGTGAAMSLAKNSNAIAFGVAISVNSNTANVTATGDIISQNNEDVTVTSWLTQNLDGDFAGKLAAQSLAGSVAGKSGKVSLAGAVSVVTAGGSSTVSIAGGTNANHRTIQGGNVTVEATDKSKLAARAGGLSLSTGASVGMGVGSTTIVSGNTVTAAIGDYAKITADSFKLNAEKQEVTLDDYKNLLDMRYLVTDSSELTDAQRKEANTGLIDLHKGEGENSYTAEVNLSSEKLLDAVDGLNFLSSQNTYAEAIAGAMGSGSTVSGSFAVAVSKNTVGATLGKSVTVNASKGDVTVNAGNGNNARIIAGSLSAAPGKNATGVTVAVMVNNDKVNATSGDSLSVNAAGNIEHTASATGDQQVFTGAMAGSTGGSVDEDSGDMDMGTVLGGAVNVIVSKIEANNRLGKSASLTAGKDAKLSADTKLDLMAISGSAGVTAGMATAAGGTINVIVDRTAAETSVDTGAKITAGQSASVTSDVSDQLISGTASLSAAPGGMGKSVAGVVNVIVSKSTALTQIKDGAVVKANGGDVNLTANNDAWLLNASLTGALGSESGIGGAFNVNVLNRSAKVDVGANSEMTTTGSLRAQSSGRNTDIIAALAAAGATGGTGSAYSGNVGAVVENNDIATTFGSGVKATAAKNALVEAYYSDYTVDAAGNIAASSGSMAVGATVLTMVKNNKVITDLGKSIVNGYGDGEAIKAASGDSVDGVYVGANAKENQFVGAAGIASSNGLNVNGEIVTLVNNNVVKADASQADLSKSEWRPGNIKIKYKFGSQNFYWTNTVSRALFLDNYIAKLKSGELDYLQYMVDGKYVTVDKSRLDEGDAAYSGLILRNTNVTVKADDDTRQLVLAGGLSVSKSAGVGAAVTTLVSGKTVEAKAHDMTAARDIAVSANNRDDITQVSVSTGVSRSNAVQIGAAVQVLKSKVNAEVGSAVKTDGGFSLTADNTTDLINAAVVLGVSSGTSSSPVGVVSYFQGETNANLKSGSTVEVRKDITISANAEKTIDQYTIGVSASGSNALSGAVNLQIAKDSALARAEQGTTLTSSEGAVNITADGDYELRAVSAAAAGGIGNVAAVNAVVSVLKNNTTAELGGTANAKGALNVKAQSSRDVINTAATLAGGQTGAGVGVMVLVAGAPMSQDAADMIAYGDATSKDDASKTFDAKLFMDSAAESNNASQHYSDVLTGDILAEDIRGNGHYESQEQVGGKDKDGNNTFDATSKYRSEDFDKERYDDTLDKKKDPNDSEKGRGENLATTVMYDKDGNVTTDASKAVRTEDVSDTADVQKAKQVNTYTYEAPTDAVIARITETAVVTADQVNVTASQPVAVDLIGATVAGGQAGIGISTAVAILHSNVSASSTGVINTTAGGVKVQADSVAGTHVDDQEASARDNGVKSVLKDALDPSNRAIRVIGVAVGVGQVSVAVSAAVALTDNVTQANGTVKSLIGKNTTGESAGEDAYDINATGNVSVTTHSIVKTDALAASVGVGATAVNAGVALSLNRLKQETGIDEGVSLNTAGNLTVKAEAKDTDANSYLLGVSIGAAGVNLNAAVSDVAADIDTHIGRNPDSLSGSTDVTRVKAGNINIQNDIDSTAKPVVLSVAGGGIAAGGNLLLAFNQTDAQASVENAVINANRLDVTGNLAGSAESKLTAVQMGIATVGISVNYADMRAANRASVLNSQITTTDYTRIVTNANGETTSAEAQTVSAEMGGLTVGLNAAIARNNTKNYATLIGDQQLDLGSLTMESNGSSTANANLDGSTYAIGKVAATAVVAMNDADARTTVIVGNTETSADESGEAHVGIVKNVLKAKNGLTFNASQNGGTNAGITTGGGTLVNVALSMAMAYGRTNSLVDVSISGGGEYAFIKSDNNANDAVNSTIKNSAASLLSMSALYGAAYSQDVYRTGIQLTGGDYTINGNVDVNMDYTVTGKADVQPSSAGVDVKLGSLAANTAVANNTAYAGTDFETSIGSSRIKGNVNVKTQGIANTDARVRTADLTVTGAALTANIAKSNLSMTQAAVLRVGGNLDVDGGVDVQSIVKQDGDGTAKATASIGTLSGEDSLNLKLADLSVSKATARENMANSAAILGAASGTEEAWVEVDYGGWVDQEVTGVDYDTVESVTYKFQKGSYSFHATTDEGDFNVKSRLILDLYINAFWLKTETRTKATMKQNLQNYFKDNTYADKVYKVMEIFLDNSNKPDFSSWTFVKNPFTGERDRVWSNYNYPKAALEKAIAKADELGIWDFNEDSDNWKEEYNYPTVTKTVQVWEEDLRDEKALIPVYDTDSNFLNVTGKMNLFSGAQNGSKTLAEAKVDMGSTYGVNTAGSVEVIARSTDSFSAMLEGMHATVLGNAAIKAASDTNATATGAKSGGLSGFSGGKIDVKAGVGQGSDYQTVNVVIGEGASLTAKSIALNTQNLGAAKAGMKQDTIISAAGIKSSSQPTESWYSTGVYIGAGAKLTATSGYLDIKSEDMPTAESIAKSSSVGIAVNFDTMKGKNYVKQTNRIDIGQDAELKGSWGITLEDYQSTNAQAVTEASGGGFLSGNTAKAENTIERAAVITVGDGATIESSRGNITFKVGTEDGLVRRDNIYTSASSAGLGGGAVANAKAYTDITSDSDILIGQGVKIVALGSLTMDALFEIYGDSYNYGTAKEPNWGYEPGIQTIAIADAAGIIDVPKTTAKTTVNATQYVGINRDGEKATNLTGSMIRVNTATDYTTIKSYAKSYGKGAVGVASSTAWTIANLNNMVWIDNASLKGERSNIKVTADNGGSYWQNFNDLHRTHLIADSFSGLDALAGKVAPSSLVTGLTVNQIRSNDVSKVDWNVKDGQTVNHQATRPDVKVWGDLTANYKRWQKKILGITITLTKANVTRKFEWNDWAQCDFCGDSGTPVDVPPYDDGTTMEERYQDAYDRAMASINTIAAMAAGLGTDSSALLALRLAKGLTPLADIQRQASLIKGVVRARYGEEDYAEAGNVFVLDLITVMEKDVRLNKEQLSRYRLWNNATARFDTYLLPNSTRMYGFGDVNLHFVSEVLSGDLRNNGETNVIDVITALTSYAVSHPVMPVGSSGSLDFSTGVLTLPAKADFELYLHEVSQAWLIEAWNGGFFQALIADQDAINDCALNGSELPEGVIVETLTDGGEADSWHAWWIGETPETASDPDQTLICLLVNAETDEVDAFRTTVNRIINGEAPVDVSLYLYRDSKADRMEIEKYNAMFFDTPEGQKSLVKVLTNVLPGRELEIPVPMRIVLRSFFLDGADWPVYSLTDHFFVLCDGTDGEVSLFDDFYGNTFDGDTFESDYIRIEGIADGDPHVTLKQGQPAWAEWTGETTAVDQNGTEFELTEEGWQETPTTEDQEEPA